VALPPGLGRFPPPAVVGLADEAEITTETIIPIGLADKFDLELAIWACLANARIKAELAAEHRD
jgi:hypothetical protein